MSFFHGLPTNRPEIRVGVALLSIESLSIAFEPGDDGRDALSFAYAESEFRVGAAEVDG